MGIWVPNRTMKTTGGYDHGNSATRRLSLSRSSIQSEGEFTEVHKTLRAYKKNVRERDCERTACILWMSVSFRHLLQESQAWQVHTCSTFRGHLAHHILWLFVWSRPLVFVSWRKFSAKRRSATVARSKYMSIGDGVQFLTAVYYGSVRTRSARSRGTASRRKQPNVPTTSPGRMPGTFTIYNSFSNNVGPLRRVRGPAKSTACCIWLCCLARWPRVEECNATVLFLYGLSLCQ